MFRLIFPVALLLMAATACGSTSENATAADAASSQMAEQAAQENATTVQPIDYLSFAQGAVPVRIGGAAEALNVGMEQALQIIDGDEGGFSATPKPGAGDSAIWFIYRLPAATTFTRFAVPNILETPSPSQTFFREIQVFGGNDGPDGEFMPIGAATLATHDSRGKRTFFAADKERAVTWVKVQLAGGINVERDRTFFEFSELIGEGRQEPVALSTAFDGKWRGRGVVLELAQEGSLVSGCYDRVGDLEGAVNGNILRATGTNRTSGVRSTFVLSVVDGNITGVRSTNGGPFRLYEGDADADLVTGCGSAKVEPPGCGDTLYGIQFDYDSAVIRPKSFDTIDALRSGLEGSTESAVTIVGHTSSEGSDAYNLDLSQRRAEAVVAALQERGLKNAKISARGAGEAEPIADNGSETGRSLNRRVEIRCQ
ncbi:OmpA family protein [Methylocystis sp.]|uniref:OmpA family protein n=1 Tax=Methylocystis sp. TaxID=1911079 RepID=UPI003DA1FA5B